MRRFGDGWLERVRVGTSMTVLMYALPPILRQLKTEHPQLEINLKAGLTAATLQMLKSNALDLGLCAMPIANERSKNPVCSMTTGRDRAGQSGAGAEKGDAGVPRRLSVDPRQ